MAKAYWQQEGTHLLPFFMCMQIICRLHLSDPLGMHVKTDFAPLNSSEPWILCQVFLGECSD